VLVGGLGVFVQQLARRHEVAGDPVGQLLGQSAELLEHVAVELLAGDLRVERRAVVLRLFG
jgi:hypothetical protein